MGNLHLSQLWGLKTDKTPEQNTKNIALTQYALVPKL